MKLPPKERLSSVAVVIALAAVLIVLGVLQYRWSVEVSEASALRMQAALHSSLLSWRQDLYRELAQAGDAFQFFGAGDTQATLAEAARRYREARRAAAHPALIKEVYVFQADGARLLRLNKTGAFEPVSWPQDFQPLQEWFQRISRDTVFYVRYPGRKGGAGISPGAPPEHGHLLLRHGPALIAQDVPALIYPVMRRGNPDPAGQKLRRARADWFILQLDRDYLRDHIFPELAERYFGGTRGLAYQVAVISVGRKPGVLYSTDRDFGTQRIADADFAVNVFGPPVPAMAPHAVGVLPPPTSAGGFSTQVRTFVDERGWAEAHNAGPPPGAGAQPSAAGATSGTVAGPSSLIVHPVPSPSHAGGASPFVRFEPIRYEGSASDWQLVVKNRGGSLEAVAGAILRRNLAISFGVLLVLAATTAIILITSQRAQRLARLQMDFVAGVSHELRTPLTVISSAADNIADGLIDNRQQVIRYGKVIQGQARQLIHLVEQVLRFAATRDRGYRYHLEPLRAEDVVHQALRSTAELISLAGITVEQQVQPNLPQVTGDLAALSQCLQNLIINAVKYGSESGWIGVRASLAHDAGGTDEIQITVEDRGAGIAPKDLERIFEPFYRSPSATAAQIHGTGLGLPLARSIAEAMNGRLTASSEPGKGSAFVLHLPATGVVATEAQQAAAAVGSDVS